MFKAETKKTTALLLALLLLLSAAGCGLPEPLVEQEPPAETAPPVEEAEPEYTLRLALAEAPAGGNPHTAVSRADTLLSSLLTPGLVDAEFSAADGSLTWLYELAEGVEDITAEYVEKAARGIPEEAESGYVFRIRLNRDAVWDDGTAITAHDYESSMRLLLNPSMENARAGDYTLGDTAIRNAAAYRLYTEPVYEPLCDENFSVYEEVVLSADGCYYTRDGFGVYINPGAETMWGVVINDYAEDYPEFRTLASLCTRPDDNGYCAVTPKIKAALDAVCESYGARFEDEWKEFCFCCRYPVRYEPVYDTATKTYVDYYLGDDGYYYTVDGDCPLLVSAQAETACGASISSRAAEGEAFAAAAEAIGEGYLRVDEAIEELLREVRAASGGYRSSWSRLCVCRVPIEEIAWEDVGLYAESEYSLVWITGEKTTLTSLLSLLRSNWLVREDLYRDGLAETDGRPATDYDASADTAASCGPYRLVSLGESGFTLVRNDRWYGWTDGKHDGQYQPTRLVYSVAAGEEAEALFAAGELDVLTESSSAPDAARRTEEPGVLCLVFTTDTSALKALEKAADDGANKRIVCYTDFRKAVALAIDRAAFCAAAETSLVPALGLFSACQLCTPDGTASASYRATDEGRSVLAGLYGAAEESGGFAPEEARTLFQSVYKRALSDGYYAKGQEIRLTCLCAEDAGIGAAAEALANEFLAEATAGTGFEGKLSVTFVCGEENIPDAMVRGEAEMACLFQPENTGSLTASVQAYTLAGYDGPLAVCLESGWNPAAKKASVTCDYDGDGDIESSDKSTFDSWADSLTDPEWYADEPAISLAVASQLEYGLLNTFRWIPLASRAETARLSDRAAFSSDSYSPTAGAADPRYLVCLTPDNQ